jgi:RNA polymerase-binding transcription factor DksA
MKGAAMSVSAISADPTAEGDEPDVYRPLLVQQWRAQLEDVTRLSIDVAELPENDGHTGTGAGTEQTHIAVRLLAAARQQLEETEAALRRLDDGTYGLCERCQNVIDAGRLEALPAARLCMSCQRAA